MTLHTAKGLEWPVVALTGMEQGLFPLARAEEQIDGLEEERRLCYVGLTRAKDKLYLSWARARRRGGELRPGIPSRFLRDCRRESSRSGAPQHSGSPIGAAGRAGGRQARGRIGALGGQRLDDRARPPAVATAAGRRASQDTPRYVKGERVRHRRFGSGTIQGLARHRARPEGVGGVRRHRDRDETVARGLRRASSATWRVHEHRS